MAHLELFPTRLRISHEEFLKNLLCDLDLVIDVRWVKLLTGDAACLRFEDLVLLTSVSDLGFVPDHVLVRNCLVASLKIEGETLDFSVATLVHLLDGFESELLPVLLTVDLFEVK